MEQSARWAFEPNAMSLGVEHADTPTTTQLQRGLRQYMDEVCAKADPIMWQDEQFEYDRTASDYETFRSMCRNGGSGESRAQYVYHSDVSGQEFPASRTATQPPAHRSLKEILMARGKLPSVARPADPSKPPPPPYEEDNWYAADTPPIQSYDDRYEEKPPLDYAAASAAAIHARPVSRQEHSTETPRDGQTFKQLMLARFQQRQQEQRVANEKSAVTLQRFFRRRRSSIGIDLELPSDSMFIPIPDEGEHSSQSDQAVAPSPDTLSLPPPPSLPTAASLMPPPAPSKLSDFAVIVQLQSARDLLSDRAQFGGGVVDVNLALVSSSGHEAATYITVKRLSPSSSGSDISWDDCCLHVDDPGVESQTVVNDWSVRLLVRTHGTADRETNSKLLVPLALLETGLASQYALSRWFPLERANPGDATRGDVRLSIACLMRSADDAGNGIMAPYVPPQSAQPPAAPPSSGATRRRRQSQTRKPPPARRPKATASAPPDAADDRPETPARPRISRAEAISPPSSPASTSSSDVAVSPTKRSAQPVKQERPPSRAPKTPVRRRSLAEQRASRVSAPTDSEEVSAESEPADNKLKKPFLKRKPYKVVFKRLDWSSVQSKTDSRLGPATSAAKTTPTQQDKPKHRDDKPTSTDEEMDASTKHRIEQLEQAMYTCCGVAPDSTKAQVDAQYQSERVDFVAAHGSNQERIEELWRRLTNDATGEFYAQQMLELSSDSALVSE